MTNFFPPWSQPNDTKNPSAQENSEFKDQNMISVQDVSEVEEESTTCGNLEEAQSISLNDTDQLVGTKKKTPMCLVNELARHHKV